MELDLKIVKDIVLKLRKREGGDKAMAALVDVGLPPKSPEDDWKHVVVVFTLRAEGVRYSFDDAWAVFEGKSIEELWRIALDRLHGILCVYGGEAMVVRADYDVEEKELY